MTSDIGKLLVLFWWIAGIVVASGFFSTLFAFLFPPWAWYVAVDAILKSWGVV